MIESATTSSDAAAPAQAGRPSIFIFIPCYGEMISSTTVLSVFHTMAVLSERGIPCTLAALSHSDIAALRNLGTTLWYDASSATHMLQVDADMGFGPELVLDMLALDEPLVGTLYRHKQDEVTWVGSGLPKPGAPLDRFRIRGGNFLAVEAVGMGVGLIRRDAVAAMLARDPSLADQRIDGAPSKDVLRRYGLRRMLRVFEHMDVPGRGRVSEDISFCLRWGECQGTVWAAIGHEIEHVGRKGYKGSFLQHKLEEEEAGIRAEPAARDAATGGSASGIEATAVSSAMPEPAAA